jgi:hypothetical protein
MDNAGDYNLSETRYVNSILGIGIRFFAHLAFAQIRIQTVLLSYLTVCYKIHLRCTGEAGIGSERGIYVTFPCSVVLTRKVSFRMSVQTNRFSCKTSMLYQRVVS